MPELPEVETMVRGLLTALTGLAIRRLEVLDSSLVQGCPPPALHDRTRRATVVRVTRRGKWVVIELAGDRGIIVIQPRMTGGFWLVNPQRPDHIRLAFHVEKPLSDDGQGYNGEFSFISGDSNCAYGHKRIQDGCDAPRAEPCYHPNFPRIETGAAEG